MNFYAAIGDGVWVVYVDGVRQAPHAQRKEKPTNSL